MNNLYPLSLGETYTIQKKVTWEDTTLHYGSGNTTTLLSTARLSDLMIESCVQFLDKPLAKGFVSLGSKFEIEHLKPSVQGCIVSIKTILIEKKDYAYHFKVEAYDEYGPIAIGYHTRTIAPYKGIIKAAENRTMMGMHE